MSDSTMVRVQVSKTEWRDLRKVALDQGVPAQQLVGDAIRALLKKKGYAEKV